MNPSLMNVHPVNYSLSGDIKYTSRDRPYEYMDRTNSMSSGMMDQQIGISPSNGLDFRYSSTQAHQQDAACNTSNSQTVLTPPQSCDGSTLSAPVPPASSYVYSTQAKLSLGNSSGLDFYPPASSNYLSSTFNGNSMTQTDRRPGSLHMRPLSPPYGFGHSFPPYHNSRASMSEYHPFSSQRPSNTSYSSFRGSRASLPFGPFPPSMPPFGPPLTQQASSRPEGPPFDSVQKHESLINSSHQPLEIEILASIPKGFFQVDDKWTCYRRNYFSVSCGFMFKSSCADGSVYLHRYGHNDAVSGYAVSISARTAAANNSESENRGLVQHTPKRDKATESIPGRHNVSPTPAQNVNGNHNSMPQSSLFGAPHLSACIPGGLDAFGHATSPSPPTQHTFERIQFQKATANNGKRRAQQQYFHVVVRLEVNVGQRGVDEWVLVASKQSHQMVVRGRSPGHYKDNRRDSQTSMDPDGGSGHNTEGSNPSGYTLHPLGPPHSSSMGASHGSYRPGHHYGTSFHYPVQRSEEYQSSSSTSPGSSAALTSSPNEGQNRLARYSMGRNTLPEVHLERTILSPILSRPENDMMEYAPPQSLRRGCNEDEPRPFCQSTHGTGSSYNPSFDFSATSSQAICT